MRPPALRGVVFVTVYMTGAGLGTTRARTPRAQRCEVNIGPRRRQPRFSTGASEHALRPDGRTGCKRCTASEPCCAALDLGPRRGVPGGRTRPGRWTCGDIGTGEQG